ncbi:MAG: hypothetical protein WC551_04330 [Patescibacteria group bacterium]
MDTSLGENQAVGGTVEEGRPLWLTCCIGCLFTLAAIIAGSFLVVAVFAGPGVAELKSLPAGYPSDLKPFRMEKASSIKYLSGSSRGKMFQILTAPIRLINNVWPKKDEPESGVVVSTEPLRIVWSAKSSKPESWYDRYSLLAQGLDSVTMSWDGLDVPRETVLNYYSELFKTTGLKQSSAAEEATKTDFLVGTRQGSAMQIHLMTTDGGKTVDKAVVVVTYINK